MKPTICIFRSCRSVEEGDYIAGAQNASVSNVRHQHSSEIAGSPERLHHRFCLQKEETSPDSAGHPWSGMLSKQRCSDELTNQARSAYRTKCVSDSEVSTQVDASFSFV